ncbi:hypothetical protein TNIN_144261 [Trichonephila inaurata madagascariensis]|uniref:Uncharacterized protein n=1 Tax=Trichonephila inaurata madagascariensis TaxID=2747483 RepID=A0A8X7BZQ4_9ARAC|nr:hypothetical protein TNIN_144261 [Trichonephila inaurata madagascariensis]
MPRMLLAKHLQLASYLSEQNSPKAKKWLGEELGFTVEKPYKQHANHKLYNGEFFRDGHDTFNTRVGFIIKVGGSSTINNVRLLGITLLPVSILRVGYCNRKTLPQAWSLSRPTHYPVVNMQIVRRLTYLLKEGHGNFLAYIYA